MNAIDIKSVNYLKYLSATMVNKANSGHTGSAVGASPILYALYKNIAKVSAKEPDYFNRDRVVICPGHTSALIYSTLHMFGFNYSSDDLKNFRQKGSKTPGHPELNIDCGIESTSGPLGQGLAMAVGMAVAEQKLAHRFNKPRFNIIDHYTYAFVTDGSLMEGITSEASSLAGTWGLNKLIVLYDSNNVSIDSTNDVDFTENVLKRYSAYGWNTIEVANGNDVDEITSAIKFAKSQNKRPTIIKINTKIGAGTILEGNRLCHGKPLTDEELVILKRDLKIESNDFELPNDVKENAKRSMQEKVDFISREKKLLKDYSRLYPEDFKELNNWICADESKNLAVENFNLSKTKKSTRIAMSEILQQLSAKLPNLIVGSADLFESTKCIIKNDAPYGKQNIGGRNLYFGVREHAMAGISNGIALHGGFYVICSTFLVFSDYLKHSIRMSAMMNLPITYVFSHDSIAVGEDGQTHQPIEQLEALRNIPNFVVFRPADIQETLGSVLLGLKNDIPNAIITTRQELIASNVTSPKNVKNGVYIVKDNVKNDIIILTSGSELEICLKAYELLKEQGIYARVVSCPSLEIFEKQTDYYKEKVMPKNMRNRLAIEASSGESWYKYVGLDGKVLSINEYGFSAPYIQLFEHFKLTPENVVRQVKSILKASANKI